MLVVFYSLRSLIGRNNLTVTALDLQASIITGVRLTKFVPLKILS